MRKPGSIIFYDGGQIQEAACWAHVRRKFYDLQVAHASPLAAETLKRIAELYAIEGEIRDVCLAKTLHNRGINDLEKHLPGALFAMIP